MEGVLQCRIKKSYFYILKLSLVLLLSEFLFCEGRITTTTTTTTTTKSSVKRGSSHDGQDVNNKNIEINYLHIYSDIRFRYARTRVLAKLTNHDEVDVSTSFLIQIPQDEFVTEFSIEQNGTQLKGVAEIKTNMNHLNESAMKSPWVGMVELLDSSSKSNSVLTQVGTYNLSVRLKGKEQLNLTFVYEGLLQKIISGNDVLLQYELNIRPEMMSTVKSYMVVVNIEESRLTPLRLLNIRGKQNPKKMITPMHSSKQIGDARWETVWNPNATELGELIAENVVGNVKIMYNIQQYLENDVILVRDGYLAYFDDMSLHLGNFNYLNVAHLSDEVLLPRHVVFILDVSGSMEGKRLEQLKLGMAQILNLMESTDNYRNTPNFIDIIAFCNKITVWMPFSTTEAVHPLNEILKKMSIEFIQNLTARGSTNIYIALEEGLRLTRRAHALKIEPKSIIFFVTDGEPTSGLIDTEEIRRRVKVLNVDDIPIFSLAFGSEADYGFCRNISSDSHGGLARKIFDLDTKDSAESFTNFYKLIVSRHLQNVTFKYTTPIQFVNEVTHENLVEVHYSERMSNESRREIQKFHSIKFDATTYEIPCAEHCLMERIFALRKIKKLYKLSQNVTLPSNYCLRAQLERRRKTFENIRKANEIALSHGFLTPCTFLIVGNQKNGRALIENHRRKAA